MQGLMAVKKEFVEKDHGHSLDEKRVLLKMIGEMHSYEISTKREALALVYPPISMEFLRWRDDKGWPRFAIFTGDEPRCYIRQICTPGGCGEVGSANFLGYRPNDCRALPVARAVNACLFDDVFKKMLAECKEKRLRHLIIWQEFSGCRTLSARQAETMAVNSGLFSEIVLICEAASWTEESQAIKGDPLLVGWNKALNQTYLIHAFDMVSIEEIVRREFTEGKLPPCSESMFSK